jgi:Na+/H+ antiporter NhaD/arsenite permease-like protein
VTVLVVAAFLAAYLLIATERVHRVAAALAGAAAMVVLGVVDADTAFFSHESGIDWNVIFLLLGMMVIVSVIRVTGLFEFLAVWVAKRVRGRAFPLMALLVLITATASALLDNVTTVLLIIPVTFVICDRLALAPVPFVIAEVMASNIGGMATLVGDPPNIIVGSRADLSFTDFLVHLGPLTLLLLVVYVGLCRVLFRHALTHDENRVEVLMALDERRMITNPRLLVKSLVVLAAVMVAFVAHPVLHMAPSVVALLGAGALVLVSQLEPSDYLAEVEWPTLVFFMGLFVMVGGLVEVGVIGTLGSSAADAVGDRFALAGTVLLFGSAVVSGVVDNIPYVATVAPIVGDLVAADEDDPRAKALWWALVAGADLGGNATAVGAGANVVAIGMAARNGHPISFWTFTRYGIVVTTVTISITWVYFWFTHFTA